jgi:hypothetical protein
LWGKTATLSVKAYCTSGTVSASLRIYKNATGNTRSGGVWNQIASQTVTITTTGTLFSLSVAIPSDNTAEGIRVELYFNNATNGISVHWYEIQLEEGSTATPFEHRPISTELALCQRYFFRGVYTYATNPTPFFFKTTMRANPTCTPESGTTFGTSYPDLVNVISGTVGAYYTGSASAEL